ncbi:hypothetical protein PFISCL1PPCAC_6968, partial [Pristionchus fissidentatus]
KNIPLFSADWFDLPAKIQPRINKNIKAFLKLEHIAETIISLLYILTIVIIIKFVLEAVYESIDVCVFCNRRPRRLFPFGLANRSASIPFIARKDKKLK